MKKLYNNILNLKNYKNKINFLKITSLIVLPSLGALAGFTIQGLVGLGFGLLLGYVLAQLLFI